MNTLIKVMQVVGLAVLGTAAAMYAADCFTARPLEPVADGLLLKGMALYLVCALHVKGNR